MFVKAIANCVSIGIVTVFFFVLIENLNANEDNLTKLPQTK